MKVALVGIFPTGTEEMFKQLLPATDFEINIVNTQEKYDSLMDAEVIIMRIFKLPKEVIERNKNLKLVEKWGAGYDTVDIEAAGKANIKVCNVTGANAYAVSEIAVLHILATYRNLINHHQSMIRGVWTKGEFMDTSFSLMNKTVGLIGGGNIGRQVATKVQAFGANVQYYDMYRLNEEKEKEFKMKYVELDELLRTSDVISLHIPLIDETRNIINGEKLALMKPTSIIVNTARGGLIDEEALREAINNKKILGAGLDCLAKEPIDPNDPMLKQKNVTLTPHIGGTSADLLGVMAPRIAKNILAFSKGEELESIVNMKYLQQQ